MQTRKFFQFLHPKPRNTIILQQHQHRVRNVSTINTTKWLQMKQLQLYYTNYNPNCIIFLIISYISQRQQLQHVQQRYYSQEKQSLDENSINQTYEAENTSKDSNDMNNNTANVTSTTAADTGVRAVLPATTMQNMHRLFRRWQRKLTFTVISIVLSIVAIVYYFWDELSLNLSCTVCDALVIKINKKNFSKIENDRNYAIKTKFKQDNTNSKHTILFYLSNKNTDQTLGFFRVCCSYFFIIIL